jgi:hypothetical protein
LSLVHTVLREDLDRQRTLLEEMTAGIQMDTLSS